MTNTPTKTYLVGVVERAIAYYKVRAKDARTAAENWEDGEFHDRDDEDLDSEGPCNVREQEPDGRWWKVPRSQWQTVSETTRFDDYEIHGIRKFGRGRLKHSEQVPDNRAQFWSLFGHIPGQGLDCIGDFETRQHAEEVYARITGRRYGSPT